MSTIRRSAGCIAAGTSMTVLLYTARVLTSGRLVFGFLLFNLLLALIPWACAVAMQKVERRGSRLFLGMIWLLFLPNGPYLITDFIHLGERPPIPVYFDALLLTFAALTGLLAAAFSLDLVARTLARHESPSLAWPMVSLAGLASGFGIYLGRFERWNSWDLLLQPIAVLESFASLPPLRVLTVTVASAAILWIAFFSVGGGSFRSEPARMSGSS